MVFGRIFWVFLLCFLALLGSCKHEAALNVPQAFQTSRDSLRQRSFNGVYQGDYLDRVAFPLGGIGAGMIALEGTGAISHVSVRNKPDLFNEPFMMAALSLKGVENGTKVLEGPVPSWKYFGRSGSGDGSRGTTYGFPRFDEAAFESRFPFGYITLRDKDIPMEVRISGWSPFVPGDADGSSLPVAALEYHFKNIHTGPIEAAFSYHAENLMRIEIPSEWGGVYQPGHSISGIRNGFVLHQSPDRESPSWQGDFAIFTEEDSTLVDLSWFRGGWFDAQTLLWKELQNFSFRSDTTAQHAVGASLYVPFSLNPGEEKTIRVLMCWYVPYSDLRYGLPEAGSATDSELPADVSSIASELPANLNSADSGLPIAGRILPDLFPSLQQYYQPWYAGQFSNIRQLAEYWSSEYAVLYGKSALFSKVFYAMDLPGEVLEAVSANLSILKSPTVMRQRDGRFWAFEGCHENSGSCPGSCTHVWNYAQALSRLFPSLERSLRETEFRVNQDAEGHQAFRATLPIGTPDHGMYAAADGQLGGIIKMYREWRLSGDTEWLRSLYPLMKSSLDYCIRTWDPLLAGVLEEPHHNTYDIEFWGPEPMCTGFYLGALSAMVRMGEVMGEDTQLYSELLAKGRAFMEKNLFNGEYFIQKVKWTGLNAANPAEEAGKSLDLSYSPEALRLLQIEGPKYQYGEGCLSDGMAGIWLARMCGLEDVIDPILIKHHLLSVHRYNFKTDLSDHVNPQRPGYALGKEAGLLLCSWPHGKAPTLPFVYSNEVWTGIEYQVASHLMLTGEVEKGLELVRACRSRYDGRIRNPFNEFECGNFYARALSSYGLLEGLTGIRYDAVDKTLFIDSRIGNNFTGLLVAGNGFGNVGLRDGKPFFKRATGEIDIRKVLVSGKEMDLEKSVIYRESY